MQPRASALGVLAILFVIMTAMTAAENVEDQTSHPQYIGIGNRSQQYKDGVNRTLQADVNTQDANSSVSAIDKLNTVELSDGMKNISTNNNSPDEEIPSRNASYVPKSHVELNPTGNDPVAGNLQSADHRIDVPVDNDTVRKLTGESLGNASFKNAREDVKLTDDNIRGQHTGAVHDSNKIDSSENHHPKVENLYDTEVPESLSTVGNVPEIDTEKSQHVTEQILSAENIRSSSFQIPSTDGRAATEDGNQSLPISDPVRTDVEIGPGKIGDGKKSISKKPYFKIDQGSRSDDAMIADHSETQKNQGPPKSTKAFYEIKSLAITEADSTDHRETTTQRIVPKFIRPTIPWMASAVGKFGPYFEDGDEEKNITARIGTTVLLDCKIGMLHDKTVTWLQHSKDSIQLLTVGRQAYSADQRISLSFRYPSNWRLQILYASLRDSGLYECQVATHPPRVKKINLVVTAPVLTIVDDAGRVVAGERHLKAGSALKLSCEARDVRESEGESVIWTRGDETLTEDVSENRTTDTEVHVIVSSVLVEKATPRHAGNYSCAVPGRVRTTVAVHVLNGELPAAVHDGNGVSRAVLNLWLVHLTVSYVFSR